VRAGTAAAVIDQSLCLDMHTAFLYFTKVSDNSIIGNSSNSLLVGSRPSDHYFRIVSVGLSVCLLVCAVFLSRL